MALARPDSGPGFQVKALGNFQVVPSSLKRGTLVFLPTRRFRKAPASVPLSRAMNRKRLTVRHRVQGSEFGVQCFGFWV